MRGRPKLRVTVSPAKARGGDRLEVTLLFAARSPTPVSRILVTFHVVERRLTSSGLDSSWVSRTLVHLEAQFSGRSLEVGETKLVALFELPRNTPPTFTSNVASVQAELSVVVVIPWWLDLRRSFVIPLSPVPFHAIARGARVFSTLARAGHAGGAPREGEPYMEATLDPGTLCLGGLVEGALSCTVVPRSVRVALVLYGDARIADAEVRRTMSRYEATLGSLDLARTRLPFQVSIPAGEVPTMQLSLSNIVWAFEITAELERQGPLKLMIPVSVATLPVLERPAALAPIGQERLARLWVEVARVLGASGSEGRLELTAVEGAMKVHVVGDSESLGLEARVTWPALGIGLVVRPSELADRLRIERRSRSKARYLWAREQEQAVLFDAEELGVLLKPFESFEIADDHLVGRIASVGQRLDTLLPACRAVLTLARWLSKGCARVPPPARAAAHLEAWRRFAVDHAAQLEVGSLSIRDLEIEGERLAIETRWTDEGTPIETVVSMPIGALWSKDLEPELALPGASLEGGVLSWRTAELVTNPSTILPEVEALARLAATLRGARRLTAYR
jgi:hypothetical protein